MSCPDGPKQVDYPNYHHIGHTAAQTCGWTANALRGQGKCYKNIFYGIESHRCIQMTPIVKCNERCVFCWRDHRGHAYELDNVAWDDPSAVADASIVLQKKILSGFGGNQHVQPEIFQQAMNPRHVAISLDGEPTLYPYLPELIEEFHSRNMSTFLVSNGTNPDMIEECEPTQLYISVDAAERSTFDKVVRPVENDAWERLIDTMDILHKKSCRTVLRTTLLRGWNMENPDWYAAFYERANPDFIEIKAYMHVGHSRDRLSREIMPDTQEIVNFTKEVASFLPEHNTIKTVPISRVSLLSKQKETWVPMLKKSSSFWKNETEFSSA
tara:strand:- start:8052 stop:9029 length:978 start_codon:yes stop_codon:yes gene_type:complete